jgi:hypothetical protein
MEFLLGLIIGTLGTILTIALITINKNDVEGGKE